MGSAKPRARTAELVVEDVGDELLIYDLRSDEAHCLDPRAAAVWRACDGKAPVANIAAATGMAEDAVEQTLRELSALSLVEAPLDHSRRDAMKLVLTAAAAIPAVRTIAVPIAGVAASCLPNGAACTNDSQCCDFNCSSGRCGPSF